MNEANKQSLFMAIRTILMVVGSLLAGKGYIDNETLQSMVGAVMVILPIVWERIEADRAERATQAKLVVAVNAGIIKADATVGDTPLASPATAPGIIAAAGPAANTATPVKVAEPQK